MNITVEQTMEMPDVVLFVRKLDAALKVEQKKRKHFYKIIDETKKMEFINGEILFQSPVKLHHTSAVGQLLGLISAFVSKNQLGFVGFEKVLISLTRNDYEPDICYFARVKSESFTPRQMQFPVPDFVVEVLSDSTEKYDRNTKFLDYAAHGVSEYWIIDPEKQTVEQYVLVDASYELVLKSASGLIGSVSIDGFSIPVRAIFDDGEYLATLKAILAD